MEKIEITKEMLTAAQDYVPLEQKEKWVTDNASKCFDRLAITMGEEPMPPMYMVNSGLRSRHLMAALAKFYFGKEYEADEADDAMMSVADYDRWAGGHVLCQLDRWKHDVEARDKCYDLLYDFHDLEKRFTAAINGILAVQNDAVMRQSQYTATQMKELPLVMEQLKQLQEKDDDGK